MDTTAGYIHRQATAVSFWVSVFRAILALVLGTAILTIPDMSRPLLTNFVGMFWLASGVVNLIDLRAGRLRDPLLGGAGGWVGILAGAAVLTYSLVLGRDRAPIILVSLGVLAILTGVMHLGGAFERQEARYGRIRSGIIMGCIELLLGLILVLSPFSSFGYMHILLAAWAFSAGITLVVQALYGRNILPRRSHRHTSPRGS